MAFIHPMHNLLCRVHIRRESSPSYKHSIGILYLNMRLYKIPQPRVHIHLTKIANLASEHHNLIHRANPLPYRPCPNPNPHQTPRLGHQPSRPHFTTPIPLLRQIAPLSWAKASPAQSKRSATKLATNFQIRDRVLAFAQGATRGAAAMGEFQEYTLIDMVSICTIQGDMSFAEASVLPLGFTTATHAL
jgi:hypothetical protein